MAHEANHTPPTTVEDRCMHCGAPIVFRKARGAYMHASASVAACDLDSDHPPTPERVAEPEPSRATSG